jgi:hypothetical protein
LVTNPRLFVWNLTPLSLNFVAEPLLAFNL